MVIKRNPIEKGDLFDFDSNIVQLVELEPFPESGMNIVQWKQQLLNQKALIKSLSTKQLINVKVGDLKLIPLWYPSVDFTKTLGFVDFDYSEMQFLQAEKLQDILLFKLLFSDKEGYTIGTNCAIGKISDLDKIRYYHDKMNSEIRKEFESEFSPVKDLNTLLFGLKSNSIPYDLNLITEYFYNTYLPIKSNSGSF